MSEQATDFDFAAMSAPAEAHKKLQPFVGTFKAAVKMWMGPGDPMESTGTMTNSWVLGERFLQHNYQGDATDGPFPDFAGTGYWGYNKASEQFEGVWMDTASTAVQFEQGTVEGNVWTMTGEMKCPSTGADIRKKSVMTLEDNDHHTLEMYFAGPDGNEMKGMEIRYTRA